CMLDNICETSLAINSYVTFLCRYHHCPHLTRIYDSSEKPCCLSEYMEKYPLYPTTHPRDSFKPKGEYKRLPVPMEGTSTTKRDYVAHEVLPVKCKLPEKYVKSDDNMDLTSTYTQDYNPYPICRVPPCLPRETKYTTSDKMNTIPTYKDDYVPWNVPKREMIKPNNKYHPSEEKFDHRTTIQDDYQFKGPVATKSYKPLNLVQKNMTPFENLTNYMLSYVPHPLEKRFVHEYEKYKPSDTPFDGLTTHKQSYRGLAGLPAKAMKPRHTVPCHDVPFPSSTEFRDKYLLWPHLPISIKKPAVYVPPVEKMDLKTTMQTHYTPHKGQPAKSCQPLAQFKKGTMPFDSCSTMKDDYKAWQCAKTKPIIHAPELKVAEEPMDYLTTFQTHYVPHPPTFTKSFKPGWSSLRSVTPFEGQTIYTSSYTPKKIARCLASYKEPPGYVFQEIDPAGHKCYLPVLETEHPMHSKGKEQESSLSGNGFSLQELPVTG
uniref:Stabilizer of axonemal microtubules 1 n=2 Tax=Crocodylus porosus TaxID=8502 RepID=A0A7M4DW93_CROPO